MRAKENILKKSLSTKIVLLISLVLLIGSTVFAQQKVTADQALQNLKSGNQRFVSGKQKHPNLNKEARKETTEKGQHPYVTIIGCSDSRVPIEAIFDAGIGEIFVIRVAGNVVDTDETGSIEYGVGHLHTPLLVVLGHSSCGAVTAVTRGDEVHGSIPALVDNIIPAVQKAKHDHGDKFSDKLVDAAIRNNVWQSIEDLLKNSSEVVHLVKEGKLKIVGAHYVLSSGEVEWLGEHPKQAELLKKSPESKHH
jgi:carbonic anhydrase